MGRLWTPDDDRKVSHFFENVGIEGHVLAVLIQEDGKKIWTHGRNRVTTIGSNYYAGKVVGISTGFADPATELGTAAGTINDSSTRATMTSKVTNSLRRIDSNDGYPKVSDNDPDNPPGGLAQVVTWRTTYGTSEAIATNISHVMLLDYAGGNPASNAAVISIAALLVPIPAKTSTDVLKIFVNHIFRSA